MATVDMAQSKKPRVRVSKNKKRNWNKYSKVDDVEEFLEEKRFEERIGGNVSEKPDEELFFIEKETPKNRKLTAKPKYKKLKCFQNIGLFSKVPPITVSAEPYSKKIKGRLSKAAEKQRKKAARISSENQDKDDLEKEEIWDLWADNDQVADPEIADLITFRDRYTCKKAPKTPHFRFQKPSLLPAVEVPHPGASCNPSYEEHQDLLRKAVAVEQKKKKDELHLKRILTDMFPSKAEAPTEQSILEEMSQGLFENEVSEDDDDDPLLFSMNPPVTPDNRLTRPRKNKKIARKKQEFLRKVEKLQKKRMNDIYRLKSFKKELNEQEKLSKENILKRQQKKIEDMYKPKTLSRHKYVDPDIEVNLTHELSDSLRRMKSDGNLLEDRFKSLQRRNVIETRVKTTWKRKYKLKVQVKRSHRNFE